MHSAILNKRGPDLLCVGAQKAATTWLYEVLRRQPRIFVPPIKEMHYFSEIYNKDASKYGPEHRKNQINVGKKFYTGKDKLTSYEQSRLECLNFLDTETISDDWYKGVFGFADPDQYCVDICPGYMNLPLLGVRHALAINPGAKILQIVRDPVDRCWSQIRMHISQGIYTAPLDHLLTGEASLFPYLFYTDYEKSISNWRTLTPSDQYKIILFDNIKSSAENALEDIFDFIKLDLKKGNEIVTESVFVGEKIEFPIELRRKLFEELEPQYNFLSSIFPEAVAKWKKKHQDLLSN